MKINRRYTFKDSEGNIIQAVRIEFCIKDNDCENGEFSWWLDRKMGGESERFDISWEKSNDGKYEGVINNLRAYDRNQNLSKGIGTALMHIFYNLLPSHIQGNKLKLTAKLTSAVNSEYRDKFYNRCLFNPNSNAVTVNDSAEGKAVGYIRDPYKAGSEAKRLDWYYDDL